MQGISADADADADAVQSFSRWQNENWACNDLI